MKTKPRHQFQELTLGSKFEVKDRQDPDNGKIYLVLGTPKGNYIIRQLESQDGPVVAGTRVLREADLPNYLLRGELGGAVNPMAREHFIESLQQAHRARCNEALTANNTGWAYRATAESPGLLFQRKLLRDADVTTEIGTAHLAIKHYDGNKNSKIQLVVGVEALLLDPDEAEFSFLTLTDKLREAGLWSEDNSLTLCDEGPNKYRPVLLNLQNRQSSHSPDYDFDDLSAAETALRQAFETYSERQGVALRLDTPNM